MAQITVTKLNDGPRNGVFHCAIVGDGGGDLNNAVIVDPATSFDPNLSAEPHLALDRLMYDLNGFSAILEFEYASSDTFLWSLSPGQYADVLLCDMAGLKDRSPDGGTGKLKISTSGLGNGDTGVIVIKLKKD